MAKGFSKPKNVGKTFARLFGYLRPHIGALLVVAVLLVVNSLSGVLGTYLLKPIFNIASDMFKTGSRDFGPIFRSIFLLALVYVVGVTANYGVNRLLMKMNIQVLYEIRCEMYEHLEKLPLKYFDSRTHGEIMSRFTNDTDTLREMLSNALPNMISSSVTLLGVLVAMFLMNWKLTLLVLGILLVMTMLVGRLTGLSAKYFRARQAAIAAASGYVEEHFEGQREVKVFCHEQKVKSEFGQLAQNLKDAAAKANSYGMILMPIMGNTSYILFAVSAMSGTSLIIRGLMDIGTLAAYLQYSKQIARPINMISQQVTSVLNALAGAERIFDLMDTPVEVDEGKFRLERVGKEQWAWVRGEERIPLRGDVRFDHVTFSYDGKVDVLKDLSLYAKPGQKIAFVGSTGAGKTTITNLINRFYDVQQGSITYDGINVKDIRKDDLRRSLGMVLQDTHLFTGTVMENIRYGRLDATDEECVAAAKRSNAHFFISHLPEGYNTVLTADGANLSQGQRQLIAIARAAVADPPVLILDEATSSIDTRTEAHIEKGMDELMKGRTVFVIAHRLSTVRNANAIMVLEHGEIIERGDHRDLLDQKGRYYQLYTGMFELS
ncbi:MAG: ABC transporter ATP-binding protein [Clostridia bacterium]|nr:ABC transporter ATP-binding protein [Clostridia bacterium]